VERGKVEIPGYGIVDITGDASGAVYLFQGGQRNSLEEIDENSVEKITRNHAYLFDVPQ
jgi:hypothetical protein